VYFFQILQNIQCTVARHHQSDNFKIGNGSAKGETNFTTFSFVLAQTMTEIGIFFGLFLDIDERKFSKNNT
jgi:hypothetical protein